MKYIKQFEKYDEPIYNCYASSTYSNHDNNINNLFEVIGELEKLNINYDVSLVGSPIIYFNIFAFPNNSEEEIILKNFKKYNSRFHVLNVAYDTTISIEKIKQMINSNTQRKKIEHDDITQDYIDMIYQTNKFNI